MTVLGVTVLGVTVLGTGCAPEPTENRILEMRPGSGGLSPLPGPSIIERPPPPPPRVPTSCGTAVDRVTQARAGATPGLAASRVAQLVRTDFTDDRAWHDIVTEVFRPTPEGFCAEIVQVNDLSYRSLTGEQVRALPRQGDIGGCLFVVDARTVHSSDHPILVLDVRAPATRTFRALPRAVQPIENNLDLANMDFAEFADAADTTGGVFRGFP